jgi:hypothetical protein
VCLHGDKVKPLRGGIKESMCRKSFASLLVTTLVGLSLVMAACSNPTTTTRATTSAPPQTSKSATPQTSATTAPPSTTASANKPQYGGTINLAIASEGSRSDLFGLGHYAHINLAFNRLWDGEWTKGRAGGYGTGQTDWGAGSTNIPDLHIGHIGCCQGVCVKFPSIRERREGRL